MKPAVWLLFAAGAAGAAIGLAKSFEVAPVKPSTRADRRTLFHIQPGGRFTVANVTVKRLIEQAYGIEVEGSQPIGPAKDDGTPRPGGRPGD